jgi:alpha-D-xyloside xylohydrolase
MDFGADPKALKVKDEYMFGPSILVAPVTTQGQTQRPVYLPAGTVWYDWWTGKRSSTAARPSPPMRPSPISRCL